MERVIPTSVSISTSEGCEYERVYPWDSVVQSIESVTEPGRVRGLNGFCGRWGRSVANRDATRPAMIAAGIEPIKDGPTIWDDEVCVPTIIGSEGFLYYGDLRWVNSDGRSGVETGTPGLTRIRVLLSFDLGKVPPKEEVTRLEKERFRTSERIWCGDPEEKITARARHAEIVAELAALYNC